MKKFFSSIFILLLLTSCGVQTTNIIYDNNDSNTSSISSDASSNGSSDISSSSSIALASSNSSSSQASKSSSKAPSKSSSKSLSKASPSVQAINYTNSGVEIRGVWVSTITNDFPSYKTVDEQKANMDKIVANVKTMGLNAIFFQVRPYADAFYISEYFPWSARLTGVQGKDPGYDPLAYLIEKAHAVGIQVHAWINPYRVKPNSVTTALSADNPAVKHPDWVLKAAEGLYFNPGVPAARDYIVNGALEIAKNYSDIDGIHFDDYFYPSSSYDDSATYNAYKKDGGNLPLSDWRRENVNLLIKNMHDGLKKLNKPNIRFGVSPSGIWANKSSYSLGSITSGSQHYYTIYADSRNWVKQGWVDYICPQIYWTDKNSIANYNILVDWWANVCKGTGVALYIGHATYKVDSSTITAAEQSAWKDDMQLTNQVKYAKTKAEYKGSIFFSYSSLMGSSDIIKKSTTNLVNLYGGKLPG
jgi:uncharacterized lipoprotein YddW (UPF0748 family)